MQKKFVGSKLLTTFVTGKNGTSTVKTQQNSE